MIHTKRPAPATSANQHNPHKRPRRTATAVLAGYFDPRPPRRDSLTEMFNIDLRRQSHHSAQSMSPLSNRLAFEICTPEQYSQQPSQTASLSKPVLSRTVTMPEPGSNSRQSQNSRMSWSHLQEQSSGAPLQNYPTTTTTSSYPHPAQMAQSNVFDVETRSFFPRSSLHHRAHAAATQSSHTDRALSDPYVPSPPISSQPSYDNDHHIFHTPLAHVSSPPTPTRSVSSITSSRRPHTPEETESLYNIAENPKSPMTSADDFAYSPNRSPYIGGNYRRRGQTPSSPGHPSGTQQSPVWPSAAVPAPPQHPNHAYTPAVAHTSSLSRLLNNNDDFRPTRTAPRQSPTPTSPGSAPGARRRGGLSIEQLLSPAATEDGSPRQGYPFPLPFTQSPATECQQLPRAPPQDAMTQTSGYMRGNSVDTGGSARTHEGRESSYLPGQAMFNVPPPLLEFSSTSQGQAMDEDLRQEPTPVTDARSTAASSVSPVPRAKQALPPVDTFDEDVQMDLGEEERVDAASAVEGSDAAPRGVAAPSDEAVGLPVSDGPSDVSPDGGMEIERVEERVKSREACPVSTSTARVERVSIWDDDELYAAPEHQFRRQEKKSKEANVDMGVRDMSISMSVEPEGSIEVHLQGEDDDGEEEIWTPKKPGRKHSLRKVIVESDDEEAYVDPQEEDDNEGSEWEGSRSNTKKPTKSRSKPPRKNKSSLSATPSLQYKKPAPLKRNVGVKRMRPSIDTSVNAAAAESLNTAVATSPESGPGISTLPSAISVITPTTSIASLAGFVSGDGGGEEREKEPLIPGKPRKKRATAKRGWKGWALVPEDQIEPPKHATETVLKEAVQKEGRQTRNGKFFA